MQPHEMVESGALAGRALGSVGLAIRGSHRAISDRVFAALGPSAAPVRVMHDAISDLAYGSVAAGLRHVPRGAGAVAALQAPADAPSMADSVGGALALGAINAYAGDRLDAERSPLAVGMHVRAAGRRVDAERHALETAFPQATPRLVVFIHGLGGNEDVWCLDPLGREVPGRLQYGEVVAGQLRANPIFLRYNTGRPVAANGADLAGLLDALVAQWPVAVQDLALVGHSMGGLVARAALHAGARDERAWIDVTRQVVCLGSPHGGAPLERSVAALARGARRIPELRPWGELAQTRSRGIKDLHDGVVVEHGEVVTDPPPGVTLHTVSACVTADRDHPFGRAVGDILVQERSATGPRGVEPLAREAEHRHHVDSAHHWTLLAHPDVAAALVRWLGRPALPTPRA